MKNKVLTIVLSLTLAATALTGCQTSTDASPSASAPSAVSAAIPSGTSSENTVSSNKEYADMPDSVKYQAPDGREIKFSSYDLYTAYDSQTDTILEFQENEISVTGDGAVIDHNQIMVTRAGTYILRGNLADGQLLVNAGDNDKVRLILDGVTMYCSTSAPIYVQNADKVILTLAGHTTNEIRDYYLYEDDSVKACIYSRCDLSINGTGSLVVTSNYNNGIASRDDLKIADGNIIINAANNGIKGKDSVSITGGTITIECSGDGIKSDNEKKEDKGFIYLGGGTINISAGDDSLQAIRAVMLENCQVYSRCYGDKIKCDGFISGEELIKEWM